MSRPIPEAYYKAQLDKAMRNDDTKKISSLMKKLQSLNARKATKVKDAPMPPRGRRRRPTPMPMPPRRRRRPTPDPIPRRRRSYSEKYYVKGEKGFDPNNPLKRKPIKRRRTPTPMPMPMPPRRRRGAPTPRELAERRARQRALLRGVPKGGNPRTRGQMSTAKMKQAMERYLKEANKKSPSRLKEAQATAKAKLVSKSQQEMAKKYQRGKKLMDANRKKIMELTGGKGFLRAAMQKATRKLTKPVAKRLKKSPPPPPKPSKKRRELSYS